MKNKSEITDNQAETTVITSVIKRPQYILHSEFLKPKHFYDTFNGTIYWAVEQLVNSGVNSIDANVLSNIINMNAAAKAEVADYDIKALADVVNAAPIMAQDSVESYLLFAKQVYTLSYKRDLFDYSVMLGNECFNSGKKIPELNQSLSDIENKLSEKYIISGDVVSLGKKLTDIWDVIVKNRNDDGTIGIPSMFPLVNSMLGGYRRQSLTVYTAGPKTGKSTLLMNEALHKLHLGIPVCYFDTEMGDVDFTTRLLACETGVDSHLIENGKYSAEDSAKIDKAMEWLQSDDVKLFHQSMPVPDMDEVYETIKVLQSKGECGILIYDYIKSDEPTSAENYNMLGNITNYLKNDVATRLDIPVLSAVQTKRDSTEVGDSWKIVRYASTIILLQEKDSKEILEEGNDVVHNGSHRLFFQFNRHGAHHFEGDTGISICFKTKTSQMWQAPNQPHKTTPFDD